MCESNKSGVLMRDAWSGRYFIGSMDEVELAISQLTVQIMMHGQAELNDLYDLLKLEPTMSGQMFGWGAETGVQVAFHAVISEDKVPAIEFSFRDRPIDLMRSR